MTTFSLRVLVTAMGGVLLFAANAMADVQTPIPEPASMTLMAVGGAGLYLLNRRRRK
jgi:lysozyme family protein